jgi:DNA mismatch endonuclease (patch repair protein)
MTDFMTPSQRSYAMSRVKGKDTGLEKQIRFELDQLNLSYIMYPKSLPGKPDITFPDQRLVIFVDGDFWHGYRLPIWENRIPPFWRKKIRDTRLRDQRNFRKLRRLGWQVIRIWQHQIKRDKDAQVARILTALGIATQN